MTGSSFLSSRLGGCIIGATVGAGAAYVWVSYTASGRKFLERFDDPNKVLLGAALLGGVAAYLLIPSSNDNGLAFSDSKLVDAPLVGQEAAHADSGEGEGGGEEAPASSRPASGPYEDQEVTSARMGKDKRIKVSVENPEGETVVESEVLPSPDPSKAEKYKKKDVEHSEDEESEGEGEELDTEDDSDDDDDLVADVLADALISQDGHSVRDSLQIVAGSLDRLVEILSSSVEKQAKLQKIQCKLLQSISETLGSGATSPKDDKEDLCGSTNAVHIS
ncbi:hypothetical protein KFL_005860060 [Klebsormidium nitens]|uniref:Uncharacterized protein n=1 Tax=Klebsormidium nitens TaxID=105231 RepID=A0A1Y1IMZ6_KLENI|nr:hypothetical protein KFL_005860060 [Klebsormidium nitens]|eukprot:GAQ89987.1 hypothetical protein KFL_005860060 [Klebsormidium nitens]